LARAKRTVEDRLREEYFGLLPDIRRVVAQLDAEVRYHLLPISNTLRIYERLVITSRIKDCESAIRKLRGDREGRPWTEQHTLTSLNDLAGVRVLAFPSKRITEIDGLLREVFAHWHPDPFKDHVPGLAFKYFGNCDASSKVKGEYQILSMLTGHFWEIEHSAMCKPDPKLRGVARHLGMAQRRTEVLQALNAFEEQFEALLANAQNI
jgi:hypothetical protein